ncbi:MAG: hypothetical protein GY719_23465 [bacterium]|nr:hypothetical protein [bacterium]
MQRRRTPLSQVGHSSGAAELVFRASDAIRAAPVSSFRASGATGDDRQAFDREKDTILGVNQTFDRKKDIILDANQTFDRKKDITPDARQTLDQRNHN